MMSIPHIENLRLENWQKISVQERSQAMQDLETALAAQENRTACELKFIPESQYESPEEQRALRGEHDQAGNIININEALVNPDKTNKAIYSDGSPINPNEPYMATETLFHEARHAYQNHIAANPELAQDSQQLSDFQANTSGGYLFAEINSHALYRWQPIEKDANEAARHRTDMLYSSEFGDNTSYPNHDRLMQDELRDEMALAELQLGSDYEETARQKMIAAYEKKQSSELIEVPSSIDNEASQDHDYYYGHGY